MHIHLVTNAFPPMIGGLSRAAGRCADMLRSMGHDVTVTAPQEGGPEADNGVVHTELLPLFVDYSRMIELVERVERALAGKQPAILLGYGILPAGFVVTCVGKLLGVPSVVSVRGRDLLLDLYRWPDYIIETLRSANYAIFVASPLRDFALKIIPGLLGRSEVILNSVDVSLFAPAESGRDRFHDRATPLTVGTSGLIRWSKGWDIFLEVIRGITEEFPDVRIRVAGFPIPPEAKQILDITSNAKLRNRIHWTGSIPAEQVVNELRQLDLYLHCSYSDGTPNSVLEAMAVGLPVVASEAGGVPEIIRSGLDGFVVPVGAADKMLEQSIALLQSPELRSRVGRAARSAVETRHHPKREAEQIEKVLYRVIQAP